MKINSIMSTILINNQEIKFDYRFLSHKVSVMITLTHFFALVIKITDA